MPSFDDIEVLADSLQRSALVTIPERCVRVRHRLSSCTRCMDACRVNALDIDQNEISFSASACINCGACASVCPTEALVMIDPPRTALVERGSLVKAEEQSPLIITCARMAARKDVSTKSAVEVPCLAFVDAAFLLTLVSEQAHDVVLVDANCSTCKYGWNDAHITDVVDQANELLDQSGVSLTVSRTQDAPLALMDASDEETFGDERRHFFTQAAAQMKQTALQAAQQTIQNKLNLHDEDSIFQALHVGSNGTLPQYAMARHAQLLDALDSFEPSAQTKYESPLIGRVDIKPEACNSCGMCAMFCPTGALRVESFVSGSHAPKQMGFLACDCVNCKLCEDLCLKRALSIQEVITASELFSFEPRLMDLGTRKPKMLS